MDSRIILGTAQFGMAYGIVNKTGEMSPDHVSEIVWCAESNGIRRFDTAPVYGDAESVLGGLDKSLKEDISFISKTTPLGHGGLKGVTDGFEQTCARLGVRAIQGLLVHDSADLLGPDGDGLWRQLQTFKSGGLVERLGVSVYSIDEALETSKKFPLDIIQAPLSIFDQRLVVDDTLMRLKESGIEVQARSIFLQGIILCSPDDLPPLLNPAREILQRFHRSLSKYGVTPVEAALAYPLTHEAIDSVVLGVDNIAMLREILVVTSRPLPELDFSEFAIENDFVCNPTAWTSN